MPYAELHGVHKVRAPQPCYLVEISFLGGNSKLDLDDVVFSVKVGLFDTKQAPFHEHYLSEDGESILGDHAYVRKNPEVLVGDVRVAFLMHYLETGGEIATPHGPVTVPEVTECPERLESIKYSSPY
jgi:hypothetical protein